jgi:hypothetical protein
VKPAKNPVQRGLFRAQNLVLSLENKGLSNLLTDFRQADGQPLTFFGTPFASGGLAEIRAQQEAAS